jgi:ATP-dependent Zn protease
MKKTIEIDGKSYRRWNPRRLAIHECGHAVIARVLGIQVNKVTLVPSPGGEGHCLWIIATKTEDNIAVCLAGMLAEVLLLDARLPNGEDFNTDRFAPDRRLVERFLERIPASDARTLWEIMERTQALVLDNKRSILKMSRVLLREKQLDAAAILAFLTANAATKKAA